MKYDKMFSPETLQKLNKKSAENLRTVMQGKNLYQVSGETQNLLSQVIQIEKPYTGKLQALAVKIARELYPTITEDYVDIVAKITNNIRALSESTEIQEDQESNIRKRRIINAVTQGGAIRGTLSFYIFREYLDEISPSLVEKYRDLMSKVFGIYDDDNAIAMMLSMVGSGSDQKGGLVQITQGPGSTIQESEEGPDKITIYAQALCFPMLVHEVIKGVFEIFATHGWTLDDLEANTAVMAQVDKLENEPEDLRYGKYIYDALNDLYVDHYNGDDSRVRDYFLIDIYKLDDSEFVTFVENAINETLTTSQLRWVRDTLKEIEIDLRHDDYTDAGLDEIKVVQPLLMPTKGESLQHWLERYNLQIFNLGPVANGTYITSFSAGDINDVLRVEKLIKTLPWLRGKLKLMKYNQRNRNRVVDIVTDVPAKDFILIP